MGWSCGMQSQKRDHRRPLKHFEVEFGLNVPSIVSTPCFDVPTTVISRCDLNSDARLWWHYPPAAPGLDLNIPEEPHDLVAKFASPLIERLTSLGPGCDITPSHGMTRSSAMDTPNS
jgi:hypothetical protein